MYRRPLQTTQRKAQKSKSQPIRQTSSGHKNLKLTNKGQNLKTLPTSKEKKEPPIRVSQSPKNNQIVKKIFRKQSKSVDKVSRDSENSKQKGRKQIVSYKSQQSSQDQLKKSLVQIQVPVFDETLDDNINLLSISNYPVENGNDFLRQTHITNGMSKNKYTKEKKQDKQKKSDSKPIQKIVSKKSIQQPKNAKSKSSSEKKDLLKSVRRATLQKTHKKLQQTNTGLKGSVRPIEVTTRGLSKTKTGKKEKSSSTQTNKGTSAKKATKTTVKSGKSPIPANLPKSVSKPIKPKKKQPQIQKKKPQTYNSKNQQSSADTTKTPTFQELQRLREQNEKYKMFLASSAFKVDELKRQIEQHKQIRQTEKSIYSFQLNNLKKQLDANKKYLGHLYSYDDPISNPNGIIPDQIIIQTDNQSSSLQDSINVHSKKSKQLAPDDMFSQNNSNKIRKSTQSMGAIAKSNQSSENTQNSGDDKLFKTDLGSVIQGLKDDISKEEALNMKFLSDIKKIPSLEVKLSLDGSDNSYGKQNQIMSLNGTQKPHVIVTPEKGDSLMGNEQGSGMLLLLNSVGK